MAAHMQMARQAVDYVLARMQGANWDQWGGLPSWENGDTGMNKLDQCVYQVVRSWRQPPRPTATGNARENVAMVIEHGQKALRSGCGNCTEFTSAAFVWLYSHRAFPIDYMSMERSDHRFLLLGRQTGYPQSPETWNPGTIVCDPWMEGLLRSSLRREGEDPDAAKPHGVYDAKHLTERMLVEDERNRNARVWGLIGRHRQEGRLLEHKIYYDGLP